MIVFMVLGMIFAYLALGLVRTQLSAYRLASLNWEDLIASLAPVKTNAITAIAVGYLNPGSQTEGTTSDDLWTTIGGADGLSRMRANSDVLVALATYAQRWNRDEGMMVAKRMRRDGMALRRAVVGIGLGMTCGYGKDRVPSYLQEAAGAYHLMRERLLVLYGTSHAGLYPRLVSAL